MDSSITGFVITQYDLRYGLNKFGERGEDSHNKELIKLHIM